MSEANGTLRDEIRKRKNRIWIKQPVFVFSPDFQGNLVAEVRYNRKTRHEKVSGLKLVAEAVYCEPVSQGQFPARGLNTGKFELI